MDRYGSVEDAGIYRIQAMNEQLLRLQSEILAHLSGKSFQEIYDLVWREVDSSTKELIELHSKLKGGDTGSN